MVFLSLAVTLPRSYSPLCRSYSPHCRTRFPHCYSDFLHCHFPHCPYYSPYLCFSIALAHLSSTQRSIRSYEDWISRTPLQTALELLFSLHRSNWSCDLAHQAMITSPLLGRHAHLTEPFSFHLSSFEIPTSPSSYGATGSVSLPCQMLRLR